MLKILSRWIAPPHQTVVIACSFLQSVGATSISLPPLFHSELSQNTDFISSAKKPSFMEGQVPKSLYPILESSSNFWPPIIASIQNCNISPYQNLDTVTITNPPSPPLIHQNGIVFDVPQHQTEFIQQLASENLNSNSGVEQLQEVSNERGKQKEKNKEKQKEKEKETWYKGHWTKSEDRKLRTLVSHFGYNWSKVGKFMARRIGKQCRERWHNNLRPPISKSIVWSDEEEMIMIEGHKRLGNKWSQIARFLPGRSENDVKNQWNKTLRRQFSSKNIQRPKRLRRLYQSKVLENYIRKHFLITSNTPPPTTTINDLIAAFSTFPPPPIYTISFFSPPPLTTIAQNYEASSSSAFAPPPLNNLLPHHCPITAVTFNQPPIPNNALIAPFSTTPPPITTINENYDALIATDLPLSVDDYDIDGDIPYFTFESAIDENINAADFMYYDDIGNAEGLIGIHPSPITGDGLYCGH